MTQFESQMLDHLKERNLLPTTISNDEIVVNPECTECILIVNGTVITETITSQADLDEVVKGAEMVNSQPIDIKVFTYAKTITTHQQIAEPIDELPSESHGPSEATTPSQPQTTSSPKPKRGAVNQYSEDGKTFIAGFANAAIAANATGANVSSIRKCLKGQRKSAGGFVWKLK